jgi:hypothetical protein
MNIHYTEGDQELPLMTGCQQSGCHPSSFDADDLHAAQQQIEDSLAALEDMLIARGWLDSTSHLVKASSSNPLRITPAIKAGALYNYFLVEHDLSEGIHNHRYARELLASSMAELRNP